MAFFDSLYFWKKDDQANKWDEMEYFSEKRKEKLFSTFLILTVFFSLIQAVWDAVMGSFTLTIIDLLIFVCLFLSFVLNETGRPLASRIIIFSTINLILFTFLNFVPKENGAYLLYIPVIIISILVFKESEFRYRNFFVGLGIFGLIVLAIFDFSLFGYKIPREVDTVSFLLNLGTALGVSIYALFTTISSEQKAGNVMRKYLEETQNQNNLLMKNRTDLDKFVSVISHDIKAPLRSADGLVRLAKLEVKDTMALEYLEKIGDSMFKLSEFVTDLLEYGKNQGQAPEISVVPVEEIIEEVIQDLYYMEGAQNIDFDTIFIHQDKLISDANRIKIILNNLVSNAIKYHDHRKRDKYIRIKTSSNLSQFQITVEDNGRGIPKEMQENVFSLFQRIHTDVKGTGLGLAIVKETTEKLQGKVELKSEPGIGSTFILSFPIKYLEEEASS
jgi:signal transduction histidine kinase